MENLGNLADQVRAGARRLEWVIKLADTLEQLGSLENAAGESRSRLEAYQQGVAEAEQKLTEARTTAQEILSTAKTEATALVAEARTSAQRIEADAASKSANAAAEHSDRMTRFQGEEDGALAARDTARAQLDALRSEVEAEQAKLDAVRQTAKDKLSRLME
jgi:chromosome segregation ATPase